MSGQRTFAALLREYRRAANLTQEGLAERSGLSVDGIGALEQGARRSPRTSTVELLSQALGLNGEQRERLIAAASSAVSDEPSIRAFESSSAAPVAASLADAEPHLATMPTDDVPPRGALRAGSRMPLTPNPLFVRSSLPRELPRAPADFTGRIAELVALIEPGREGTISTIDGMGGIGKSALAVHAAHRLAAAFPDGQLYLDLQGAAVGRSPVEPAVALGHLLRSLGATPDDIPATVPEASARFRSLAAGKRLLFVLDDAAGADQVRPLLPGSSTCHVIITSRAVLGTLEGSTPVHLGVLSGGDALDLLSRIAGRERVEAEQAAAKDVVCLCGWLPLALRVAGARLTARPGETIADLAARLADASLRLETLRAGDLSVRASFEVSLSSLDSSPDPVDREAATAFGLASLAEGPDLPLAAAACLLDIDQRTARSQLERLVDAQLMESPASDRYRFHEVVRLYARERATRIPVAERLAAIERLAAFSTATAWRTLALLRPGDRRLKTADPRWTRGGLTFGDAAAAARWLEAERANLVATIRQVAALAGAGPAALPRELPGQLACSLFGLLTLGHLHELAVVDETAVRAVRNLGDRAGEASAHNDLGLVYEAQGRFADAGACHERARDLYEAAGDRHGQAAALGNLGLVHERMDRPKDAIACQRASLDLFRQLGGRRGEAISLHNLGVASARAGRLDEALEHLHAGLSIFGEIGAPLGQAAGLHHLGLVYEHLGRWEEAVECQGESLRLYREQGSSLGEAHSLMGLGGALARMGRHEDAINCLSGSLEVFRRVGARRDEAVVLRDLGDLLASVRDDAAAREAWHEALTIAERLAIPEADGVRRRLILCRVSESDLRA